MIWRAWRSEAIPLAGLLIAATGLITNQRILMAVGLFWWGLVFVAGRMAHHTLQRLEAQLSLPVIVAEPGQTVAGELCLKNPMPWPLMHVEWKLVLPASIEAQGPGQVLRPTGAGHQTLTGQSWVGPKEEIRIRYRLAGSQRGRWPIGPGSFTLQDPLSQAELIREDQATHYLTIWPHRYAPPFDLLDRAAREAQRTTLRWTVPDPLSIKSVRAYQPGDPRGHLAVYATARVQQLMVKETEPITDRRIHVLLHPKTAAGPWYAINGDLFEDAICAAASLVETALAQGFVTDLWATGAIPGQMRGFHFTARHASDVGTLLTALAWLQPSGTMDDDVTQLVTPLLAERIATAPLLIVSPLWPEILTASLISRRRPGVHAVYIAIGDTAPSPLPAGLATCWRFHRGRWSHA